MDDITSNTKQAPQVEKHNVSYFVEPYEAPIPFPRRLEQPAEEALARETMENLKKIRINRPLLKEIRQFDNYAGNFTTMLSTLKNARDRLRKQKLIEKSQKNMSLPDDVEKLYWESTNDNERVGLEWEELSFNNWGEEKEDHEELKTNAVLEIIHDKMGETWFSNDKDGLEGIIDYLEPNPYNRFTSPGNERKCNLLGIDEIPRTSANVATVRVVRMDKLGAEWSAQGTT
ncbi:hypothetical protein Tco_0484438 [Tanacetum coccineum]